MSYYQIPLWKIKALCLQSHLGVLKSSPWLCTQRPHLVGLRSSSDAGNQTTVGDRLRNPVLTSLEHVFVHVGSSHTQCSLFQCLYISAQGTQQLQGKREMQPWNLVSFSTSQTGTVVPKALVMNLRARIGDSGFHLTLKLRRSGLYLGLALGSREAEWPCFSCSGH